MFDIITERAALLRTYQEGYQNSLSPKTKKLYEELMNNVDEEVSALADVHFEKVCYYFNKGLTWCFNVRAFGSYRNVMNQFEKKLLDYLDNVIMPYIQENLHKLKMFRNEINRLEVNNSLLLCNLVEIYRCLKFSDCSYLKAFRYENNDEIRSTYILDNGHIKRYKYATKPSNFKTNAFKTFVELQKFDEDFCI